MKAILGNSSDAVDIFSKEWFSVASLPDKYKFKKYNFATHTLEVNPLLLSLEGAKEIAGRFNPNRKRLTSFQVVAQATIDYFMQNEEQQGKKNQNSAPDITQVFRLAPIPDIFPVSDQTVATSIVASKNLSERKRKFKEKPDMPVPAQINQVPKHILECLSLQRQLNEISVQLLQQISAATQIATNSQTPLFVATPNTQLERPSPHPNKRRRQG